MPTRQPASARWLVLPLLAVPAVLSLSSSTAAAQAERPERAERPNAGPPAPDDPRLLRHRRMVEESERASASAPPGPRPVPNPVAGIVQLPIDTSRPVPAVKLRESAALSEAREVGREVARAVARAAAGAVPPPPQPPPPPCPMAPGWRIASLLKAFPEVTWHVCVRDVGLKALWVGPVRMRRTAGGPWMEVLFEAGLAEIFVPYHQVNFRPYDLMWTSVLNRVYQQDAGLGGQLVQLTNMAYPTVVAEVRERGIGWMCKGVINSLPVNLVRRGQEFVVWGVSDGGNYDNLIEYGFRDDGTMTFRMGNTGMNSPADPVEPHTHNALWRVDMDLNGWPSDTPTWLTHGEPSPSVPLVFAKDDRTPLGVESGKRWDGEQFTSLLIEDGAGNGFGHKLGYVFSPWQDGLARHFGYKELWTQQDLYVTRYHGGEQGWMTQWQYPDDYLLTYLNGESVAGQDLVTWVKTSGHHHPTDEDRAAIDLSNNGHSGVTLTHWSGFKVEPFNLFNANPLGGPTACY
jgi:primary-amine oxidase